MSRFLRAFLASLLLLPLLIEVSPEVLNRPFFLAVLAFEIWRYGRGAVVGIDPDATPDPDSNPLDNQGARLLLAAGFVPFVFGSLLQLVPHPTVLTTAGQNLAVLACVGQALLVARAGPRLWQAMLPHMKGRGGEPKYPTLHFLLRAGARPRWFVRPVLLLAVALVFSLATYICVVRIGVRESDRLFGAVFALVFDGLALFFMMAARAYLANEPPPVAVSDDPCI